ncbi:MAG: response regulator [Acidobacteriota bacterium]
MTKKALVIDDSRAMRTILGGILGELGYEVQGAEDGSRALDILNAGESFDLALVDWNMPQMSGYDFVCEVRRESRFSDLRLMMVTTETEVARMSDALEAGADEYIMKPFNKDMLLEKLMLLGIEADRG